MQKLDSWVAVTWSKNKSKDLVQYEELQDGPHQESGSSALNSLLRQDMEFFFLIYIIIIFLSKNYLFILSMVEFPFDIYDVDQEAV